MKKLVSLLLILCLFLSTGMPTQANIKIAESNNLTVEDIDQLSSYIYQKPDGELFFNKEKAIEVVGSIYNENDMMEMENMTQYLNEKVEKGEVYIDHQEETKNNGQSEYSNESESLNESVPINFGISPVKETQKMVFCLSKAQANNLRNDLQKKGLSTYVQFLISAGISGAGLYKYFGAFSFIIGTVFSLVTMGGSTKDLEQTLNNAAWDMNSNNYVVLTTRVENVWNSFGNWVNKKPPNKMNYLKTLKYKITTYRVPGGDLKNYL